MTRDAVDAAPQKMKRLLNVLGALVSDLTQNELAARGACRCHKFRSGGLGR